MPAGRHARRLGARSTATWRLVAIDGTTFDLPDTKANVEAFGRPPRSGRGEAEVGYPQIRMVGLVECGTHVVFAAATGPLRTGEHALARRSSASLRPGMLLLADRGFFGVDLWQKAAATGADLLWRVRKDIVLPMIEQLPDGSYLTEIFDQRDIHHTRAGVRVRAVEYTIAGHEGVYRLITTILDPAEGPGRGTGRPLRPAVGVRVHPGRDQDPPRRSRIWSCARSTPTAPSRNSTASCSSTTRSGT